MTCVQWKREVKPDRNTDPFHKEKIPCHSAIGLESPDVTHCSPSSGERSVTMTPRWGSGVGWGGVGWGGVAHKHFQAKDFSILAGIYMSF